METVPTSLFGNYKKDILYSNKDFEKLCLSEKEELLKIIKLKNLWIILTDTEEFLTFNKEQYSDELMDFGCKNENYHTIIHSVNSLSVLE